MRFSKYQWHGSTPATYEFDGSVTGLIEAILRAFNDGLPLGFDPNNIEIAPYNTSGDRRYVITAPGYGVLGFTDGAPSPF